MKTLYVVLFVLGCVLPLSQLVPWVAAHGVDPRLFVSELFANRISSFFGLDVIVSAVVLLLWLWEERRRRGLPYSWVSALATVTIGVSAGLPLCLYLLRRYQRS
jgi:hypothetical protein